MSELALSNGTLRCVLATRGAELRSLQHVQAQDECIWQRDPAVWAGSAPILFPYVGRLKGGSYLHRGQHYALPIHGFARHSEFTVQDIHRHGATLVLEDSPETRAVYPFRFVLRVSFTLDMHCLHVRYRVANPGTEDLLFCLGSHPGFRLPPLPRGGGGWMIAFSEAEDSFCFRLRDGLLAPEPEPIELAGGRRIALKPELFERDALIFKRVRSRHVRLQQGNGRVRLSVATGGAPSLGLWARPGAAYVCIEPWFGHDDDPFTSVELARKPGVITLPPGQSFQTEYAICVPPAASL